jgi:hypothetical protein
MNRHASSGIGMALMALAAGVCAAAAKSEVNEGLNLNLRVQDEASATDVGLPAYPGSRPYKESDESSSGASLGLSVPGFGLKVVATKLESGDSRARVAAFYRRALAKYGTVLDCSDARDNQPKHRGRDEDGDQLVCDVDDPGDHSLVYKVGTESNQRIVAIKAHGNGTRFSLVHVDKRER